MSFNTIPVNGWPQLKELQELAEKVGNIPTFTSSDKEAIEDLISNAQALISVAEDGAEGVPYDNTESGLTADEVQGAIDEMVSNFGAGVDEVYNACVTAGATPASKSPADIATAIGTLGGGELTQLYSHKGTSFTPTSESYTITAAGKLIVLGYAYMDDASLKINNGTNKIAVSPYGAYMQVCVNGVFDVAENDVVTFALSGSGSVADFFDIYLLQ